MNAQTHCTPMKPFLRDLSAVLIAFALAIAALVIL
jgi:hypothetical protein